jgi:vacuolar-type H+-ATPase subunit D/Vma8
VSTKILVNFQCEPEMYTAWKEQTDSLGLKYGDRLRAHIEADVRLTEQEHRVLSLLAEVKDTLERINSLLEER